MKGEVWRILWKHSALRILLVVAAMLAAGIYLQRVAVEIQTRPIVTKVVPRLEAEAASTTELAFEDSETVTAGPDDAGPLSEAVSLMEQGKDLEGIALLQAAIEEDPTQAEDPRVPLALAQALIRVDENEEAMSALALAQEGTGYDARIKFNLALVSQRTGDVEGAVAAYREALELRPTYYEASFNLGTLLLKIGDVDQAVLILKDTVPLAGGDRKANALYNLGIALGRTGQYLEAEEAYQTAIKFAPSHLAARLNLALLYREHLGRGEDAEIFYNEVLALDGTAGSAYEGLAHLELDRGNPDLAEEYLRLSITHDPTYDSARRELAELLSVSGRVAEARRELEWIIENGSERAEATFQLGRIEYGQRDFAVAAEYYRLSFELSGDTHMESLNNLGLAYKAMGAIDDARSSFQGAIELDRTYANAHYNLGILELEEEQLSAAEESFLAAVEVSPDFAEAWYNLGVTSAQTGRNQAAIDAYEESLRLQPANVKARLNLAVQYRRDGKPDRALEQYRLVLALNPAYASAWFNLALLQKTEGNYEEAESAYQEAIRLEPDVVTYWQNLSALYGTLGRIDEAIALLIESLDVHPDSGVLRYNLALQYKKQDDPLRALEELQRTVAVNPSYVRGWLALADTQSDLNDHTQAIASYSHARELDPGDAYTTYQLGKEYLALDDFETAIPLFEDALLNIRDNAWIWYNLGKAQQGIGQDVEAQENFDSALAIDPTMGRFVYQRLDRVDDSIQVRRDMVAESPADMSLRIQLARLLAREGRADEALQVVTEANSLAPENATVWAALGRIQADGAEITKAGQSYGRAHVLDPTDGEIALEYGQFLLDIEKPDNAVPVLESAVATLPLPLEALRDLGDALYDTRDYPRAIEIYARAKALEPEHGRTVLDLGKAYYRNKQYDFALREFDIAQDLMSEYEWSYIWLGRALNRLERFDEAQRTFDAARVLDPGFIQSYISLGDLAANRGEPETALRHYRAALEIDPVHESTRRKVERIESAQ